jgi:hypothetical protein
MSTEQQPDPDRGVDRYVYVNDEARAWDSFSAHLITEIRGAESPEEAAAILEQRAPWLSPLATWLRDNAAYAGWLSLVVTVILHFVPSPADGDPPPPPPSLTQVEETLQEILEELHEADRAAPSDAPPEPPATPGTAPPTP